MKNRFHWLLVVCVVLLSCGQGFEKANTETKLDIQKRYENYDFDPSSSLMSRLKTPPFIIDYLAEMDSMTNYAAYTLSPDEQKLLADYLELLPPLTKALMQERCLGLYFVENLLGSGITDWVLDKNSNVYIIIAFNPKLLHMDITDWASWKENTCFIPQKDGLTVRVNLGKKYKALLHNLLHESTHLVDYLRFITPYTEPQFIKTLGKTPETTVFVDGIWEEYKKPFGIHDFPLRKDITMYGWGGGPKVSNSQILKIYSQLTNAPFVSLYGATMWVEDLAEMVAYYYFTEKLNQPYAIEILSNESVLAVYHPMESPKVRARLGMLSLFDQPR